MIIFSEKVPKMYIFSEKRGKKGRKWGKMLEVAGKFHKNVQWSGKNVPKHIA